MGKVRKPTEESQQFDRIGVELEQQLHMDFLRKCGEVGAYQTHVFAAFAAAVVEGTIVIEQEWLGETALRAKQAGLLGRHRARPSTRAKRAVLRALGRREGEIRKGGAA